jgi:cell division protein FtsN
MKHNRNTSRISEGNQPENSVASRLDQKPVTDPWPQTPAPTELPKGITARINIHFSESINRRYNKNKPQAEEQVKGRELDAAKQKYVILRPPLPLGGERENSLRPEALSLKGSIY